MNCMLSEQIKLKIECSGEVRERRRVKICVVIWIQYIFVDESISFIFRSLELVFNWNSFEEFKLELSSLAIFVARICSICWEINISTHFVWVFYYWVMNKADFVVFESCFWWFQVISVTGIRRMIDKLRKSILKLLRRCYRFYNNVRCVPWLFTV